MTLKTLPNESMPREKLLQRGPQALSDAELLAIFLRTGTQGMNVIELSDFLIQDFGSLRQLFSASEKEFCQHKGLGQAKYVQLQAVLEMTQRYLAETLKRGDALTSPEQTKLYLSSILRDRQREAFYILFLDNQHRVIKDEILFEGLPLGSIKGETYSQVEIKLKKKDTFVFISDGLPEATNKNEQMLGYKAVLNCVRENGSKSAEEIKQILIDLGKAWLGELRNQDDITIVVVKKN